MFAIEDELQGNGISTAYATTKLVQAMIFLPGDEVQARITNGENISKGDKLVSNGDGTLKKAFAESSAIVIEQHVVAYAREANDMSGSSGADDPLCLIEIA